MPISTSKLSQVSPQAPSAIQKSKRRHGMKEFNKDMTRIKDKIAQRMGSSKKTESAYKKLMKDPLKGFKKPYNEKEMVKNINAAYAKAQPESKYR